MALLAFLPVMAWDHLYIIGEGTPTGWSLDDMIEMKETADGSNVYVTVLYLDNEKGGFRLQPDKAWVEDNYYGAPSAGNQNIDNDIWMSMDRGESNIKEFKVVTPGVYYVEANLNSMQIKINRMDAIYMTGDFNGWSIDNAAPLNNSQENPSQYWGNFTLSGGDFADSKAFKFLVDKGGAAGFDIRFFLLKENRNKFRATTLGGDVKWTVGDPDQSTHEERDIVAGTYNILVDAATKAVKFFRQANSVNLVGPGVLCSWSNDGTNPSLTSEGDGRYSGKHIFFRGGSGNLFKVVVDGKYYGSDTWETTTVEDNTQTYMRVINVGSDFNVGVSGLRNVTVRPSDAGDGTICMELSAPQDVWYDGVCALEYDDASVSYVNKNGFNWLQAGLTTNVNVGGDVVATRSADRTGWYSASVTFNGYVPSYNLSFQSPSIEGEAIGSSLALEEQDAEDGRFIRRRVYLTGGQNVRGRIGSLVSENVNVASSGYYTVSLYMADNSPRINLSGPFEAHMPLTEADFNDGRKHYFLVGQRMGAWRLQPEWEFIPRGDGTYAIPTRALYNGYVMVGEVDNYEDYITQTYRGYSHTDLGAESKVDPRNNDQEVTRELPLSLLPSTGKNGCLDGKYTDTRYNDIKRTSPATQHGGWDAMKLRLIHILTPDGYNDIDHIQSLPSRVNSIILSVDDQGHPSNIKFEGLNTSPHALAEIRTFSLVGGGIKNRHVTYGGDNGVTSPLNNQPGYNGSEWSEAWIQYDSQSKPYVDGNGEYIYHTSFTRDWLRAHPSYFNFGDDFEYTSNNITFVYNPDITHADQFGQRTGIDSGGDSRPEVLHTYFSAPQEGQTIGRNEQAVNNLNDVINIPAEDRACFVVEDMWMEGMFKVWCGWGGSATNYEFEDNGTTHTRWFRSNGGHGRTQEDCTAYFQADKILAYTLFEDVDAANFGIGYGLPSTDSYANPKVDKDGVIRDEYKEQPERRYFKRVEVWFNLKNGFAYKGNQGASLIIFYQEESGPTISISKSGENHVSYNFSIPLITMTEDADNRVYGNVKAYRVYRIPIDDNGAEGEPVLVEEKDLSANGGVPRNEFGNIDIVDPKPLPSGRYRYMVETTRMNTLDNKWKSAKSNIIRVNSSITPSGIENVGQDGNDAFRLNVNAIPGEGMLNVSANGEIGLLTIYSVNGSVVNRLRLPVNAAKVDISALPAGVYIANSNNCSVRFIKR